MNQAPLQWVKQIQSTLMDAKEIPLHGYAPPFPWDECSSLMGELLQAPELTVSLRKQQFLPSAEALSGLGSGAVCIALEMTPLTSHFFFVVGREDVAKLATLTLTESNGGKGFTAISFQEGYYYFLVQRAISVLDTIHPFGSLAIKMAKSRPIPEEDAFCLDIEISHPKEKFWARIVCPRTFYNDFKGHFNEESPPPLTGPLAEQLKMALRLEVGSCTLPFAKWNEASVGDLLVLDRCTFDPNTHKGTITLCLHETPLLRARIKENSLKIVDYAFYQEEKNLMIHENPDEDEYQEELFDEEEIPLEETSTEQPNDENHLWSEPGQEVQSVEEMISTKEIPLTITVEVGRLSMTLAQLLELSPGNMLEMNVRPEQGVDLTISGKKVAKGELVKLGEVLGVKILKMGT